MHILLLYLNDTYCINIILYICFYVQQRSKWMLVSRSSCSHVYCTLPLCTTVLYTWQWTHHAWAQVNPLATFATSSNTNAPHHIHALHYWTCYYTCSIAWSSAVQHWQYNIDSHAEISMCTFTKNADTYLYGWNGMLQCRIQSMLKI